MLFRIVCCSCVTYGSRRIDSVFSSGVVYVIPRSSHFVWPPKRCLISHVFKCSSEHVPCKALTPEVLMLPLAWCGIHHIAAADYVQQLISTLAL